MIPEEDSELKKELMAMVQMQIGQYYLKRLEIGVGMMVNGYEIDLEKVQ